tara:strand:- start:10531 stop:11736 length:1206 start_codon:yes stop_codon:yes gene_type:complete
MIRAAFLLSALVLTAPAQEFDWPQWRGPLRDGISKETNWVSNWGRAPLKVKWRANVGLGYSSMATSASRVYTMGTFGDSDTIFCLNSENGQELWRYSYPCSGLDLREFYGPRCTPTVDGKLVFTLSRLGHLICLNADNGKLVWTRNIVTDYGARQVLYGFSGSPLVIGNTLIVETGSPQRSVIGLNKNNGQLLWGNGSNTAGYSSPMPMMFGAEPGFVMFSAQTISGRIAKTGKPVFSRRWTTQNGNNIATPIVWQNKVFVSSGYDTGCALFEVGQGYARPVWSNKNMRNHFSSSVLMGGHFYGFDESELVCMDLLTGRVKWRTNTYGEGSLMGAGNKLIIQSENGQLAVVEATPWKFTQVSRRQIFNARRTWTVPVLSNGLLLTRDRSVLICLDVSVKEE